MCESGDCGLFCILFTALSSKSVTDYTLTSTVWHSWHVETFYLLLWSPGNVSNPSHSFLNWTGSRIQIGGEKTLIGGGVRRFLYGVFVFPKSKNCKHSSKIVKWISVFFILKISCWCDVFGSYSTGDTFTWDSSLFYFYFVKANTLFVHVCFYGENVNDYYVRTK